MNNIRIKKNTNLLCAECGLHIAKSNKDVLESTEICTDDFNWNINKPASTDTIKCPLCKVNYIFRNPEDSKIYLFTEEGWV